MENDCSVICVPTIGSTMYSSKVTIVFLFGQSNVFAASSSVGLSTSTQTAGGGEVQHNVCSGR